MTRLAAQHDRPLPDPARHTRTREAPRSRPLADATIRSGRIIPENDGDVRALQPSTRGAAPTQPSPGPVAATRKATTGVRAPLAESSARAQQGGLPAITPAPTPPPGAEIDERTAEPVELATAVFVTGTGRLEPGRRYAIVLEGTRLRFHGPTDVDPRAVALDRSVGDVEAQALAGRLLLSEPRSGSGLALAFMSVAGPRTDALAEAINRASRDAAPS